MMKLIAAAILAGALLYAAGTSRIGMPFTLTWCASLPIAIGITEYRICVDHHFTVRFD